MKSNKIRKRFSWLHFSDLHWSHNHEAISQVQWDHLHRDLEVLHEDSGPWDAIFITGDIAFTGSAKEYGSCTQALQSQLLDYLDKLDSHPVILTVPGNHDVDRSGIARKAEARLLRFWSEDAELRRDFWMSHSIYRTLVEESFSNYLKWFRDNNLPKPQDINYGIIPGDFSTSLTSNGLSIGVVGLNSAFLELTVGRFKGRLALNKRQLNAVCDNDPDSWLRQHDFNVLLTHHPPSWLEPESQRMLRADIAVPGRFNLHLCGSHHEELAPVLIQESPALLAQAPSMGDVHKSNIGYISGSFHVESGVESLTLRPRRYNPRSKTYVPDTTFDPRVVEEYLHTFTRRAPRTSNRTTKPSVASSDISLRVERIELKNFRNFERLTLDFNRESSLPGYWTCLAGMNGAGKSSILQALCLILLGEPVVLELGGERLERMQRLVNGARQHAEVRAWLNQGGRQRYVELKLGDMFKHTKAELDGSREEMLSLWKKMRAGVLLAYGATRNLSDYQETRYLNLSADVRRVMTLFDPLTQIASAEVLLKEHSLAKTHILRLFKPLLEKVFGEELGIRVKNGRALFTFGGEPIDALDLPDGFRSSVAWLVDLCAVWSEKAPRKALKGSLLDVEAIVLIDEIDLHLHPSLQRVLIPRLRKALPKVQWIVTTHSPLVLSSFHSSEIIALDRSEPGGVRFLDRQILGFSTDQIYDWLMETQPTSAVMEEKLTNEEVKIHSDDKEGLAELLEMSPRVDSEEAEERVHVRREKLRKLKSGNK